MSCSALESCLNSASSADTKTQLELYNQASNVVRAKYSEIKDQVQLIGAFRSAALEDGKANVPCLRVCRQFLRAGALTGTALQAQMEQVAELEQAIAALERAATDMEKQTRQVESLAQSLPLMHLQEYRSAAAASATPAEPSIEKTAGMPVGDAAASPLAQQPSLAADSDVTEESAHTSAE